MRLTYYGYVIAENSEERLYRTDLSELLECFCSVKDTDFRNSFDHLDGKAFLIDKSNGFFLYVVTKRNEIIKKLNNKSFDVSEIEALLSEDESIGFASYVYFGHYYFAFASSQMAPRHQSFAKFIENILHKIGLKRYNVCIFPFMGTPQPERALRASFLGRTNIKIPREHGFFQETLNILTASTDEFASVESIEIIIRPKSRENIKRPIQQIINNPRSKGLDSFKALAKLESLEDNMVELYLEGKGQISDIIAKGNDLEVKIQIQKAIAGNQLLAQEIQNHETNERFTSETPNDLALYNDLDQWPSRIRDIS